MAVVIQVDQLRRELARRAGRTATWPGPRLSPPTITAAMAGRPISPRTLRLVVKALTEAPVIDGVDLLL